MAVVASFGGWVGEAVVEDLVKTVTTYLEDQIAWRSNIKIALMKLEAALSPIKVALERAEKRELNLDENPELAKWIWQLRDAVEEAEDVLDEMEYYRLEDQILRRDAKEKVLTSSVAASSGFRFKLSKFFNLHGYTCCSTSLLKHSCSNIGKRIFKMDDTLKKLNAAVKNLKRVADKINVLYAVIDITSLHGGGSNSNTPNSGESGHVLTADVVVGREEDEDKVLKWLTESGDDCEESYNISALTIWGIGGLGKTTLAQSVYNHDSLKGYFQVKMWVYVSDSNLDMVEVMKRAIESSTGSPPKSTTLTSLQEELKHIVEAKKCLLVLDDVWEGQDSQNLQQWENFIKVLSRFAERGSKMIITSRNKAANEIIMHGCFKKVDFPMSGLTEDKSLILFNKYAFHGQMSDKHNILKPVGKRIAKKCGGVPLALKIVGGLLYTRIEYGYWDSVSKKEILNLEQGMNNFRKVLKFSYQCLPSHLQACFRIFSLFPQHHIFQKDELVTLWMGLGCIKQDGNENTKAEEYLGNLVRRSFLIPNDECKSYSLHCLLHELAQEVSEGECLRIKGNKKLIFPKTLRHLFVDQFKADVFKEISSLKRLRTLSLSYNYAHFPDGGDINDILRQLTSLRALFITTRTMPNLSFIEQLKHLRLFHMRVNILNKPLKSLYKLYQLQHLRIVEVKKLSMAYDAHPTIEFDGIGNLVKLRSLDLPYKIFAKLAQLRHLADLQKLKLRFTNDSVLKLSDLKSLNKLHHLSIIDERDKTSCEEAQEANLGDKECLETLFLSFKWTNHDPQLQKEVCNCLVPHKYSNIKDLKVTNYSGVEAPRWMTSDYLPYLTHLELSECDNLENLPALGQLPSLKVLSLKNIAGVKQSGTKFFGSDDIKGFPSLEELQIKKMENWEDWIGADNLRWFPCLHKLYIDSCQRLKALPALPLCLKELHLRSLGLIALPMWQDGYSNAPLLEYLEIYNFGKLMNFQLSLYKCVHLSKLSVANCKGLKVLPALPLNLKKLELISVGLLALPAWQDGNEENASPSLEYLKIKNCEELVYLQPFLSQCSSLKVLWIDQCLHDSNLNEETSSVDFLDGLTSITHLTLRDSTSIRTLDCSKSLALQQLTIEGCENLTLLVVSHAHTSLTDLTIVNCNNLISSSASEIESFRMPTQEDVCINVKQLFIDNILLLQIEPLRSVKAVKLSVSHAESTTCLPHQWLQQNDTTLTTLKIWVWSLLESLPDKMPSSLTELWIFYCPLLKSLPDEMPSSLLTLEIISCPALKSFPEKIPSSLTTLTVESCVFLESLPEEMPSSLTTLYVKRCFALKSLPDRMPSSLTTLTIESCTIFEALPDEMPASLTTLSIMHCPVLKSLPVQMPSSLMTLQIMDCPQLKSFPDKIPSSLSTLTIEACPLFESFPDELPASLTTLHIKRCLVLKSLPDHLPNSLMSLGIANCPLLKERYKEDGGPEWHKIAHLARVYIQ